MNPIYLDASGNYRRATGPTDTTQTPNVTPIEVRNTDGYESITYTGTWPDPSWTTPPNLTDLGAGVWASDLLVDPS